MTNYVGMDITANGATETKQLSATRDNVILSPTADKALQRGKRTPGARQIGAEKCTGCRSFTGPEFQGADKWRNRTEPGLLTFRMGV